MTGSRVDVMSFSSSPESSQSRQMRQVLEILQDGKPHKAGEMAFALGIHSRTVRRILHYLRDQAGLNITTSRLGFSLVKKA